MFNVEARNLGSYDVAVCGGGIAGVCAAVSAAEYPYRPHRLSYTHSQRTL